MSEAYFENMKKIGTPCFYTNGNLLDCYPNEYVCREGYFLGFNKNGEPNIVDKITGLGTGCQMNQINFRAPWFGAWGRDRKYRVDTNPYRTNVPEGEEQYYLSVLECLLPNESS